MLTRTMDMSDAPLQVPRPVGNISSSSSSSSNTTQGLGVAADDVASLLRGLSLDAVPKRMPGLVQSPSFFIRAPGQSGRWEMGEEDPVRALSRRC